MYLFLLLISTELPLSKDSMEIGLKVLDFLFPVLVLDYFAFGVSKADYGRALADDIRRLFADFGVLSDNFDSVAVKVLTRFGVTNFYLSTKS
jgi:hypothetical protein